MRALKQWVFQKRYSYDNDNDNDNVRQHPVKAYERLLT